MTTIKTFTFNPFSENTLVLYDSTGDCIIIDAGCQDNTEKKEITGFIEKNKLKPVRLLNTHCHIDHVLGVKFLADTYNLKPEIHEKDLPVLRSTMQVALMWSIPNVENPPEPQKFLKDGDKILFGESELEVRFTPGHSPGHVVFVSHAQKFAVVGDVLFYGSIGRTDLPGGDYDTLITSIKEKLFTLGDDFKVYPGHGPETTIGYEKKNNPFLQ